MTISKNKNKSSYKMNCIIGVLLTVLSSIAYAQGTAGVGRNQVVGRSVYLIMDRDKDGTLDLPVNGTAYNYLTSRDNPKRSTPYVHWINNDYDAPNYNDTNGAALAIQNRQHDTQGAAAVESVDDLKDLAALAIAIQPYSADIFTVDNFRLKIRSSGLNINVYKKGWTNTDPTLSLPGTGTLDFLHSIPPGVTYTELATSGDAIDVAGDIGFMRLAYEITEGTGTTTTNQVTCLETPEQCYLEVLLEDANGNEIARRRSYLNFLPVRMSYKLPNELLPLQEVDRYTAGGFDDEPTQQSHKPTFRVLAGPRLRFDYKFPNGATNTSVTWTFPTAGQFAGAFCADLDVATCAGVGAVGTAANTLTLTAGSAVWQQTNWTLGANNVANTAVITAAATYTLNGVVVCNPCEQEFQLKKRELQPVAAANPAATPPVASDSKYMRGQDVAILEQILWQLGLSPQDGFPGKGGDRIDNIRNANGVVLNRDRDIYSVGHNYVPVRQNSTQSQLQEARTGSLEKMIRRLHARYIVSAINPQQSSGEHPSINGNVENDMLGRVKEQYEEYLAAYRDFNGDPTIDIATHGSTNNWVSAGLGIWSTSTTYTQTIHTGLLDTGEALSRNDLLRAWVIHESAGLFWGAGHPQTNFRTTVGESDEFGSIGFNQILFQTVYGANQGCNAVRGHNQYHPESNLENMTRFMSEQESQCAGGGTMHSAFILNNLDANYLGSSYDNTARNTGGSPTLRGYFRSIANFHQVGANATHDDDGYELLSKAIQGYNGGPGRPRGNSWIGFLVDLRPPAQNSNAQPQFSVRYAIQIKSEAGFRLRTYTLAWEVTAAEAVASTFNVGDTFCFNYSESDWLNQSWETVKNGVLATPSDAVNCTTGQ